MNCSNIYISRNISNFMNISIPQSSAKGFELKMMVWTFQVIYMQLIRVELAWQITKLGDSPNIWDSSYYRQWQGLYERIQVLRSQKVTGKTKAVCTFACVLDRVNPGNSHFYVQLWSSIVDKSWVGKGWRLFPPTHLEILGFSLKALFYITNVTFVYPPTQHQA